MWIASPGVAAEYFSPYFSPHFTYNEFVRSQLAARYGIDNRTRDKEIIAAAQLLAKHVLEPIREKFGPFSPTSWHRCEKLEWMLCRRQFERWYKKSKYADDSASIEVAWEDYFSKKSHPKGEAADIVLPYCSALKLFDWIYNHIKDFDQLILEGRPGNDWVHVSFRKDSNRNEALEILDP